MNITANDLRNDLEIQTFMKRADRNLQLLGYTEHGFRHADVVAKTCVVILEKFNAPQRTVELGEIAAYLHDIGNLVNRELHAQTGATIAFQLLHERGMDSVELAEVCSAIGNHHEEDGTPISKIAASLILADKADVHRSRVRNPKEIKFDIHDRVNYAVTHSKLNMLNNNGTISLDITVDTQISPVMEYFEIFLSRMIISQKAALYLGAEFELIMNGTKMI